MLDKERVRDLYTLGYTSKEISIVLKENFATVNKCIQRNFKNDIEIYNTHKENKENLRFMKDKWKEKNKFK